MGKVSVKINDLITILVSEKWANYQGIFKMLYKVKYLESLWTKNKGLSLKSLQNNRSYRIFLSKLIIEKIKSNDFKIVNSNEDIDLDISL